MTEADVTRQYVLFHVGPEEYGLPIARVSSIIRFEPATPVPKAPPAVDGVINLRGRVIPVVDLGKRLFDTTFEPTSTARIVVAEGEGGAVGLAVDSANEVATVSVDRILPPPETALSSETADAFEGVVEYDGRLIILLDLDRALPRSNYESSAGELQEGAKDV
jgi:purine-binding chemotaxis protein CheW